MMSIERTVDQPGARLMSFNQNISRESVEQFILSLLGIDPQKLIDSAIKRKLKKQNLTYEVDIDASRASSDEVFIPRVIRLSDGRVFVETLTEIEIGDNWGEDYYSFVLAGEPYTVVRREFTEDGVEVSEEIFEGEAGLSELSLEDVKEAADEVSSGMGEFIGEFMQRHGISKIS